jgi:uncharacterized metal-binding protein
MKPASELSESLVALRHRIDDKVSSINNELGENEQLDKIKKEYRKEKIKNMKSKYNMEYKRYLVACKNEGIASEPMPAYY